MTHQEHKDYSAKYPIIPRPTPNQCREDEWKEKLVSLFYPRLITVFLLLSSYPHGRLLQHAAARGFSPLSVFLFSARPRFAPYFNLAEGVKRVLCDRVETETRKQIICSYKSRFFWLVKIEENPEKIPAFRLVSTDVLGTAGMHWNERIEVACHGIFSGDERPMIEISYAEFYWMKRAISACWQNKQTSFTLHLQF